jgi:hypothetical protein
MNMKTIFLSDNFKGVQSFCEENGLSFSRKQAENNLFSVEVAVENGNFVDFRVFDPFQKIFDGYVYPDGWSNWLLDYVSEEEEEDE